MELSKRLSAVAGLVTEGASVADIGTDHGYIPIFLVKENKSKKVLALDINKGPLEHARIHIAGEGLTEQIETRLSDGLEKVKPGEVDEMIAAGMGGGLVIHILEEGKSVVDTLKGCILQPQSEIDLVRKYLITHGFFIEREDMVEEDGKYYPMMRVIPHCEENTKPYEPWEYLYGRCLLEQRHPVLKAYIQRELSIKQSILDKLQQNPTERVRERIQELEEEILIAKKAFTYFERRNAYDL